MFGKKKKLIEEQEKTIAELNGRLKEQQLQMEGLNSQLDEYKKREYAISRAITDAAEAADRILADAQKESDDIHDTAQKDFEASQQKGEDVVQNAYENARDIVKKAEEASEEKIRQTDEAVCAYVQLLNQFNESMKEQAKQAEENVKKLCDYYARLNNALPELFAEVPQLSETIGNQGDVDLVKRLLSDPDELVKIAKAKAKSDAKIAAKAGQGQSIKDMLEIVYLMFLNDMKEYVILVESFRFLNTPWRMLIVIK